MARSLIRLGLDSLSWLRGKLELRQKLWFHFARRKFGACGHGGYISRTGRYSFEHVFLGNDVIIGPGATLLAVHSRIVLMDKAGCGPGLYIVAGDRNTRPLGKFIQDFGESEKEPHNDLDIVLEEDVWVGGHVIILNGVRIGRGAVVGAGSVVRGRIPPYSIASGNPARPHRLRGTVEEILAHEAQLYPQEKRLPRQRLEAIQQAIAQQRKRLNDG